MALTHPHKTLVGAEYAISLLSAFLDGTEKKDPGQWNETILARLLDELQLSSSSNDTTWETIQNVLISMMIIVDWILEANYPGHKFEALASFSGILYRSLDD